MKRQLRFLACSNTYLNLYQQTIQGSFHSWLGGMSGLCSRCVFLTCFGLLHIYHNHLEICCEQSWVEKSWGASCWFLFIFNLANLATMFLFRLVCSVGEFHHPKKGGKLHHVCFNGGKIEEFSPRRDLKKRVPKPSIVAWDEYHHEKATGSLRIQTLGGESGIKGW